MKILHLIFSLNIGGSENLLVDLINQQVISNEVTLCIINNAYNETLLSNINKKIKIVLLNRKESSHNICDVFRLNFILIQAKPDIVHCHDSNIIQYLFHPLGHTILTVHSTNLPLKGIKKYKNVVAISKSVAEVLYKKGLNNKITTIYNAINTQSILLKEKKERNKNIPFRLIQVGRLEHLTKGQHLSIKAISLLKKQFPFMEIHIDFIGSGNSETYLKAIAEELDVISNVHFLGARSKEYVYTHLKNYDILLQPSIIEGFGLTVAEGMVAGLPVLVSDVEGPMEIIQNGEYGYCFQVGNAEDMANKLIEMLQNPTKASEIARNGQAYATSHFDIKELVLKYDELYKKSLK